MMKMEYNEILKKVFEKYEPEKKVLITKHIIETKKYDRKMSEINEKINLEVNEIVAKELDK